MRKLRSRQKQWPGESWGPTKKATPLWISVSLSLKYHRAGWITHHFLFPLKWQPHKRAKSPRTKEMEGGGDGSWRGIEKWMGGAGGSTDWKLGNWVKIEWKLNFLSRMSVASFTSPHVGDESLLWCKFQKLPFGILHSERVWILSY